MTLQILYLSGARLPSEMAHGIQIMQNCEAFAANNADVRLWYARQGTAGNGTGIWAFYGVAKSFTVRRLPSINLHTWLEGRAPAGVVALAFYLMLITFGIVAGIGAWFARPDVIYCRDPLPLLVAALLNPWRRVVWEAHSLKTSGRGAWMQRRALLRSHITVAITQPLRTDLLKLAPGARIMVAHDGIRAERFSNIPEQAIARSWAGWPKERYIVGYMGRLTTYNMTKGIDILVDAIASLPDRDQVALALVGGPDDIAEQYKRRWESLGLGAENFLYAGQVASADVPHYLSAFDVCTIPFPRTEHFAFYTSPLKLFEYMASGRAIVASDLPSWSDVLRNGENALLVTPESVPELATAIGRLMQDVELRKRLSAQARSDVFAKYTWGSRARTILASIST